MMTIQGPVRSFERQAQSQLVWTVEEDHARCSGIPSEFTFSFAMLQQLAHDPFRLHIQIIPTVTYLTAEGIPSTTLQYRRQICDTQGQYSYAINEFQFGGGDLAASNNVEEQLNTMVKLPGAPWPN